MKNMPVFALVFVLSACTAYVPVQQDYSKNERLQVDLDATLALRDNFREQRKQAVELEKKEEIANRIMQLNRNMVSIKTLMGYPQSIPDPIDAIDPVEVVQQVNKGTSMVSAADYGIVMDI